MLNDHVFNSYIHHAVRRRDISQTRATQILLLATDDGSCETSEVERAAYEDEYQDRNYPQAEEHPLTQVGDVSLYEGFVMPEELAIAAQTLQKLEDRV